MAVTAPNDTQWTAMVDAITGISTQLATFNSSFTDFKDNIAAEMLKMARCDRLENGLSAGPPRFAGPCQCDADITPPSLFWEEEYGECCTPLDSPSPDDPVSPPKCVYTEDGTPSPPDRLGLPEGLEIVHRPADPSACPPSTGEVCIVGTPAEGTGSLEGIKYRFRMGLSNCAGTALLECSLMVKKRPEQCDPHVAP